MPVLSTQRSAEKPPRDRTGFTIYVWRDLGGKNKERINIQNRTVDLHFIEGGKKANRLKLTIEDFYLENSTKREFVRGAKIIVQWGYPGEMGDERRMVVQKVKGNHKIIVEGLARTVKLHGEQKPRTFLQKKVSDVVKQILGENGWKPNEMDVEDTEIVHDTLVQGNQTDAQFIRSLADQEGFEWGDEFDGFRFKRAVWDKPPTQEFRYYTSKRGDIIKFEADGNIAPLATSVQTGAIDFSSGKVVTKNASNEDTKRSGTSNVVDGTGRSRTVLGTSNASQAIERLGVARKVPVADAKSAKRIADRKYIAAARSSFKLKMELVGDAKIKARTTYAVTGIGKEESGRYHFQIVEHHAKAGRFINKIEGRTDLGQGTPTKAKVAKSATPEQALVRSRKVTGSSNAQSVLDRLQAQTFKPKR